MITITISGPQGSGKTLAGIKIANMFLKVEGNVVTHQENETDKSVVITVENKK